MLTETKKNTHLPEPVAIYRSISQHFHAKSGLGFTETLHTVQQYMNFWSQWYCNLLAQCKVKNRRGSAAKNGHEQAKNVKELVFAQKLQLHKQWSIFCCLHYLPGIEISLQTQTDKDQNRVLTKALNYISFTFFFSILVWVFFYLYCSSYQSNCFFGYRKNGSSSHNCIHIENEFGQKQPRILLPFFFTKQNWNSITVFKCVSFSHSNLQLCLCLCLCESVKFVFFVYVFYSITYDVIYAFMKWNSNKQFSVSFRMNHSEEIFCVA